MKVLTALHRELEAMPAVKDSALAGSAEALARMLDDPDTRDSARTSAARELRETLSVLRADAAERPVDTMTEFERRQAERDRRTAAAQ